MQQNLDENAPIQVKKTMYSGLKAQITLNLKTLERYFQDFATNQSEVRSAAEKLNLYEPLRKCEANLDKFDIYLKQHSAFEALRQQQDENFIDEELAKQIVDRNKYNDRYGDAVVKVNRLCSTFNKNKKRKTMPIVDVSQATAALIAELVLLHLRWWWFVTTKRRS